MNEQETFEEQEEVGVSRQTLLIELDGYEGPLDLLLNLARDQKVDLAKLSILQLAIQYLEFVEKAQKLEIELAADYLVMAAWLAYLKSKLLLPKSEEDESDELSGEALAEALALQLRRLEAIRLRSEELFSRPLLGRDVFRVKLDMPVEAKSNTEITYTATLYDLMNSYGDSASRKKSQVYEVKTWNLFTPSQAMTRLSEMIGQPAHLLMASDGWIDILNFMPDAKESYLQKRSGLASTLAAGLEMVKQEKLDVLQDKPFAPIYFRPKTEDTQNKDISR